MSLGKCYFINSFKRAVCMFHNLDQRSSSSVLYERVEHLIKSTLSSFYLCNSPIRLTKNSRLRVTSVHTELYFFTYYYKKFKLLKSDRLIRRFIFSNQTAKSLIGECPITKCCYWIPVIGQLNKPITSSIPSFLTNQQPNKKRVTVNSGNQLLPKQNGK